MFITGVSIDDDDNFFGGADMFFDFIVDALDPPHEGQQGITTGLAVNVIGDVLELLIEAITAPELSDEDKEYIAYVKLIEDSNLLGAMREVIDTPCQPSDATYTADLFGEEESTNGTLTYQIVKTNTGELCYADEPVKTEPKPEPKPDPVPEPEKPKVVNPEPEVKKEPVSSPGTTDATEDPVITEPVDNPDDIGTRVEDPDPDIPADNPDEPLDSPEAKIDPADISPDPADEVPEKPSK